MEYFLLIHSFVTDAI